MRTNSEGLPQLWLYFVLIPGITVSKICQRGPLSIHVPLPAAVFKHQNRMRRAQLAWPNSSVLYLPGYTIGIMLAEEPSLSAPILGTGLLGLALKAIIPSRLSGSLLYSTDTSLEDTERFADQGSQFSGRVGQRVCF